MFITNHAYRSPVSDILGSASDTYWRAMELTLLSPWFIVSFRQAESIDDEYFDIGRTVLLADTEELELFVQDSHGGLLSVDSVQIMTPGHINGTSGWKMDLLRAVWTAPEPECDGFTADVFETDDGKWYVRSNLGTQVDDLKVKSIRFSSPIGRASSGLGN